MAIEIDLLAVGDANAFVIRLSTNFEEQVIVVDGGNTNDGDKVIRHIKKCTTRKDCIDLLINTHPDADHIDGLYKIVDTLRIGQVWIHDPNAHELLTKVYAMFLRHSSNEVIQEGAKSLSSATDLINLIDYKGIPRIEPFAELSLSLLDNAFLTVLGPTKLYYEELLSQMTKDAEKSIPEIQRQEMMEMALKSQLTARDRVDADNDRSPCNNSSVIFSLQHNGKVYLFTGDAGPTALDAIREEYPGLSQNVDVLQVPHHGSKRSITSSLIDHFNPRLGLISAAGKSEHHPSKDVVEVLNDIQCGVYSTINDRSLCYSIPNNNREGYGPATPLIPSDLD